jgi:hypothetical protein
VLFTDNFDSNTLVDSGSGLGLNQVPAGWTEVSGGTVDIIGSGPSGTSYDLISGNGYYIDMDGSTSNSGDIRTGPFTFNPGLTYSLSYQLAGNQRGAGDDSVEVFTDGGASGIVFVTRTLSQSDPFTTFVETFTVSSTTSGRIAFRGIGGDNQGLLLDNVSLTAVPLPAAAWLFGTALLGMLGIGRRKA